MVYKHFSLKVWEGARCIPKCSPNSECMYFGFILSNPAALNLISFDLCSFVCNAHQTVIEKSIMLSFHRCLLKSPVRSCPTASCPFSPNLKSHQSCLRLACAAVETRFALYLETQHHLPSYNPTHAVTDSRHQGRNAHLMRLQSIRMMRWRDEGLSLPEKMKDKTLNIAYNHPSQTIDCAI